VRADPRRSERKRAQDNGSPRTRRHAAARRGFTRATCRDEERDKPRATNLVKKSATGLGGRLRIERRNKPPGVLCEKRRALKSAATRRSNQNPRAGPLALAMANLGAHASLLASDLASPFASSLGAHTILQKINPTRSPAETASQEKARTAKMPVPQDLLMYHIGPRRGKCRMTHVGRVGEVMKWAVSSQWHARPSVWYCRGCGPPAWAGRLVVPVFAL